jgi:hypothetical protein
MNSEVLSLAEKQRFGYDDNAQPLCVYCFFAPPPSYKLPSWVTPRKPFQYPTRAAPPPPPMPVVETEAAADSDEDEQEEDDGGGVDMDGVAFDNDEREIDDADAELEKEAANDGAMLD